MASTRCNTGLGHVCAHFLVALTLWGTASVTLAPSAALAQLANRSAEVGSTSRADRDDALSAIPFRQLVPRAAQRIHAVASDPTIYRRLPVESIDCDPDLFVFLVRNPEVVVEIWKLMGVTQLTFQRTGQYSFEAADGAGTHSQIELVYGTPDRHVYFGQGYYEGPLLKQRIRGECVLLLRSEFIDSAGRPIVRSRLDVFLKVDRTAVDVLAKTFHPLVGKAADINFVETARFLSHLSQTAERNGPGVTNLAYRLTGLTPTVRQQFIRIASTVTDRTAAADRQASGPTQVRPAAMQTPTADDGAVQWSVSRHPPDGPYLR